MNVIRVTERRAPSSLIYIAHMLKCEEHKIARGQGNQALHSPAAPEYVAAVSAEVIVVSGDKSARVG